MRGSRGRWAAAGAGVLILAVPVFVALEWRELVFQYRCFRLDRTHTYEEARPWLWAITGNLTEPEAAERLSRRLGPGTRSLTFWVFSGLDSGSLPFLRALCRRLERDERLLALWSHFLRWRRDPFLEACLAEVSRPGPRASTAGALCLLPISGFSKPLEQEFEAKLRLAYLRHLAVAWVLGMPRLPSCPEFKGGRRPEGSIDFEIEVNNRLISWLDEEKGFLELDVTEGRFYSVRRGGRSPRSSQAPSPSIPPPSTPWPGWKAPVPSLPPPEPEGGTQGRSAKQRFG